VSFYNETSGRAIYPTPIVGMVGLLEDAARATSQGFVAEGDAILLLGETREELGASEYLAAIHGIEAGRPPRLDLERERAVEGACRALIAAGLARSAHDASEGGLAVALAECGLTAAGGPLGAEVELPGGTAMRPDALLFGESASRILVTVRPGDVARAEALAREYGAPCAAVGRVDGERLRVAAGPAVVDVSLRDAAGAWENALTAH
jgi:phosphoribosylformylglycinamidine synthase